MTQQEWQRSDAAAAPADGCGPAVVTADLRILATSDIHMQLLAHDYLSRESRAASGLERLAPLIARHRRDAANVLLFDNGDLLQGNPLADHLASVARRRGVHPAIASLNALGCDAATLGNHDFAYGRGFLAWATEGARFPIVLANARLPGFGALQPWTILRRVVTDRAGLPHGLAVGVIGFVPPQTAAWEAGAVPGLRTEDVIAAARRALPQMRAAGADIVVALVHGGVSAAPHRPGDENAAAALATLPGIDAVVAGHVHEVLPPEDRVTIHAPPGPAPLVMPGCGASHLGVIDLTLLYDGDGGWRVAAASARCEVPGGGAEATPAARAIRRAALPVHAAALKATNRRVGRSTVDLGSRFAMLGVDAGLRLIAMAQRWHMRRVLAGTPHAGLPVLVAVAPFRAGGRAGPGQYTAVPAGRLRRRDIADLYAFPNRLAAVTVTGADLQDWLERAASAFHRLQPGVPDQPLLDEGFASYNFDMIDGLDWRLDLTHPAAFSPEGATLAAPGRVGDLRHGGRAVAPEARFVLVTNAYRLSGVGLYGSLTARLPVIYHDALQVRQIIAAYLRRLRQVAPPTGPVFRLAPVPGASAVLRSAPDAAAHLAATGLPLTPLGHDAQGFLRLRLSLDQAALQSAAAAAI